jgi:hypothetical protein
MKHHKATGFVTIIHFTEFFPTTRIIYYKMHVLLKFNIMAPKAILKEAGIYIFIFLFFCIWFKMFIWLFSFIHLR